MSSASQASPGRWRRSVNALSANLPLHASDWGWLGAVYALPGSTGLSLLEEAICLKLA